MACHTHPSHCQRLAGRALEQNASLTSAEWIRGSGGTGQRTLTEYSYTFLDTYSCWECFSVLCCAPGLGGDVTSGSGTGRTGGGVSCEMWEGDCNLVGHVEG